MPHILLVNPSPRKGTKKMATAKKAKRTPKQLAATAKMIRANKARRKGASQPRAPVKRAAAVKRAPARAVKRRSGHRITSRKAASTAGRVLRYRRPNPMSFVTDTLLPSAVGGAGALALDVVVAVLPLPVALKTGPAAPLVKVAGAVGLGMLAGAAFGRRTGEQVAAGALTVTIYNFAKAALIKIGGGKIPGLSVYPDGPMGEFVSGADVLELGYTDSGMQVGEHVSDGGEYAMNGYETGVYR